ncbi:MAG: T9SS type A sorting domain-containing protein [Bacteroidia bacterium]|nr:T9SS type A sorting domain-containing protein [Bacteroidia bacterium]
MVTNKIFAQSFDTIDVFSIVETQDINPPMKFYYNYRKQHIYNTGLFTYKIKIDSRQDSLSAPIISGNFPTNISFIIDSNKVSLFYDTSASIKYTIFNFNVVPGDTLSVLGDELGRYCNYGTCADLKNIKIKIDSISNVNFGKIGNKSVYYYHLTSPFGMGNSLRSYWIKGLINGTGGILNEYVNTEPRPIAYYTTCFTYNDTSSILIPAYFYNKFIPKCTSYIMGILNKFDRNLSLTIYPNPATNTFSIAADFEKSDKILIKLTNVLGDIVQEIDNTNVLGSYKKTVNIEYLPDGLYLLSIQYRNDLQTIKILKINR